MQLYLDFFNLIDNVLLFVGFNKTRLVCSGMTVVLFCSRLEKK